MRNEVFKNLSDLEKKEIVGGSFIWVPVIGPVISILATEMLGNK